MCGCRYKAKDLTFLPMSGLLGHNVRQPIPKELCPWYSGPTLFQVSIQLMHAAHHLDSGF